MEEFQPDVLCLQETKLRRRRLPGHGLRLLGLRRRAPRRGAVERRGHRQPGGRRRRSDPASDGRRPRRRGPPADRALRGRPRDHGLRAQRPDPRRRPVRSRSWPGWPACRPSWPSASTRRSTRSSCAATLNIAPDDRDVYDPAALRRHHPHQRARAGRLRRASSTGGWSTCSGSATTQAACTRGGTTVPATSTRARACASTTCWPPPPLAERAAGRPHRPERPQGREAVGPRAGGGGLHVSDEPDRR